MCPKKGGGWLGRGGVWWSSHAGESCLVGNAGVVALGRDGRLRVKAVVDAAVKKKELIFAPYIIHHTTKDNSKHVNLLISVNSLSL